MWPELWRRKLVISPVTQTRPTCCSSKRRICQVSSVTERTLRDVCSTGNNSPKSHCDLAGRAIALNEFTDSTCRFRQASYFQCLCTLLIDPDERPLQEHAALRDLELLR